MTKQQCIDSYIKQNYKLQEIGLNQEKPKALLLRDWQNKPTNTNIGKENMYAVIQEDNKLVFDFDDIEFNELLNDYLNKTLVVKTANEGTHYYFKDISRVKPIKTSKLYSKGKVIGDIKAHKSYVVGCGSSYKENGITKEYTKISNTYKVLEIDCEKIIKLLKEKGITTSNIETKKTINSFKEGLKEGNRNNECFKTSCNLFEKQELDLDSGLAFMKTWNSMSKKPLDNSELVRTVKSAWNTINDKPLDFDGVDKIDNCVIELKKDHTFVTPKKTEIILLFNGKIYDNNQAETLIKEKSEKLITNCTKNNRLEVIDKIKAQTFVNLEDFDSDPNIITLENGILNLEEKRLTKHTPNNLSQVLFPLKYFPPEFEINEKTIFKDIKQNLKDTMFYQYLVRSFTVDGRFRKNDFETVLETIACCFIKRQIDDKAFMFLGGGKNGKSVCLEYIESLLGRDSTNVSHISLQDIAEDKFMGANLFGVSVNLNADLEEKELKHTGKVKNIISGDGIVVQKKYGHPFNLYPFCKLIFSCNRFPKVYDQSEAFFRRWIIIKWDRSFISDPENIPDLKIRLKENQDEKNKVFSALVPLANKLNRLGEFTHAKLPEENKREWNENADPLNSFISNYIIQDIAEGVRKTKIATYQFYRNTMYDLGEVPLSMAKFGRGFMEVFDDSKVDGIRYWLNINFRLPKQEKLKEKEN